MATEPFLPEPANPGLSGVSSTAEYPELPGWLRELYPFRTRTLATGACRISLVDEGPADATPVLMLHGNPGWSFSFRDVIPELSRRYRVIAPDLVGFGLSDKPADPDYHTLAQHIENLTSAIEQLELRSLTLLLHDWGGPIGLGYAIAHPENVTRIVLTNTWAFPIPNPKSVRLPFGVRLASRGGIGELLDSVLSLSITSALSAGTRTADDMIVEGYKYPAHSASGRLASRAFWRMLHPGGPADAELERIHAGLKNITAPVDIVWGARDPMLSRLPAFLLRDAFRNSHSPVFLDEASHYVAEDAPEVLVEKLLERPKSGTTLKIIG